MEHGTLSDVTDQIAGEDSLRERHYARDIEQLDQITGDDSMSERHLVRE